MEDCQNYNSNIEESLEKKFQIFAYNNKKVQIELIGFKNRFRVSTYQDMKNFYTVINTEVRKWKKEDLVKVEKNRQEVEKKLTDKHRIGILLIDVEDECHEYELIVVEQNCFQKNAFDKKHLVNTQTWSLQERLGITMRNFHQKNVDKQNEEQNIRENWDELDNTKDYLLHCLDLGDKGNFVDEVNSEKKGIFDYSKMHSEFKKNDENYQDKSIEIVDDNNGYKKLKMCDTKQETHNIVENDAENSQQNRILTPCDTSAIICDPNDFKEAENIKELDLANVSWPTNLTFEKLDKIDSDDTLASLREEDFSLFEGNESMKLKLNERFMYYGEKQDNQPHGKGCIIENGIKHKVGDFNHGQLHGMGFEYDKNERKIYKGQFKDGKYDGIGTYFDYSIEKNQSSGHKPYTFKGWFKEGRPHAMGHYIKWHNGSNNFLLTRSWWIDFDNVQNKYHLVVYKFNPQDEIKKWDDIYKRLSFKGIKLPAKDLLENLNLDNSYSNLKDKMSEIFGIIYQDNNPSYVGFVDKNYEPNGIGLTFKTTEQNTLSKKEGNLLSKVLEFYKFECELTL